MFLWGWRSYRDKVPASIIPPADRRYDAIPDRGHHNCCAKVHGPLDLRTQVVTNYNYLVLGKLDTRPGRLCTPIHPLDLLTVTSFVTYEELRGRTPS